MNLRPSAVWPNLDTSRNNSAVLPDTYMHLKGHVAVMYHFTSHMKVGVAFVPGWDTSNNYSFDAKKRKCLSQSGGLSM